LTSCPLFDGAANAELFWRKSETPHAAREVISFLVRRRTFGRLVVLTGISNLCSNWPRRVLVS